MEMSGSQEIAVIVKKPANTDGIGDLSRKRCCKKRFVTDGRIR